MTNRIMREIECPKCEMPVDVQEHDESIVCLSCQSEFELLGRVCPNCSSYHTEPLEHCENCKAEMIRDCVHCEVDNWAGDEECVACGGNIRDVASNVIDRFNPENRSKFLEDQREMGKAYTILEEEAALKRRAELDQIEEDRLRHMDENLQRQRVQEKQLFGSVLIGSGLLILLLILSYIF